MKTHRLKPLMAALALCWVGAPLAAPDMSIRVAPPTSVAERQKSNAAERANAILVYALGAAGKGVVIGLLDTGVNAKHQDLVGRVDVARAYNATTKTFGATADQHGHGTFVSSLIVASMDGVGMYGVASQATILPVTVFAGVSGTTSETYIADGLRYTIGKASIVNLSLGGISQSSAVLGSALIASVQAGQLLVVAAGNNGGVTPLWPARYAKDFWANGQIIAVGAVDAKNKIANFSNKAGDAKNFYLVAMGVGEIGASATNNAGYVGMSGTSGAAPIVAGVAADVKGFWPYLNAQKIAQVLFKSATHLGTSKVGTADAIYGWGAVNAAKALQPLGLTGITMKGGQVLPVARTSVASGTALSGALKTAAASGVLKVSALDEMGRNFNYDLGAPLVKASSLTAEQVFGASDRQMRFADQVIDRQGSRLTMATDLAKGGLQFGSMHAFETRSFAPTALAGLALTRKFADDSEVALGTMGMQNFFGVAGMELADAPSPSMPAFSNGYFSLVPGATTVGYGKAFSEGWKVKFGLMSSKLADVGLSQYGVQSLNTGASMSLAEVSRKFGDAVVGLSLANVSEATSLLGMTGQQAFALANAPQTMVTTLNGAWRLAPGMALAAYYSIGSTHAFANGAASLVTGASEIRSDAFGVGLVKSDSWKNGDRFALSVSQPLRAVSGSMAMDAPTGMTEEGVETRAVSSVSLASPARELLLEANYTRPLSKQSSLGFSFISRMNPGGVAGPSENVVALRYGAAF